jgi:hypothetical protein
VKAGFVETSAASAQVSPLMTVASQTTLIVVLTGVAPPQTTEADEDAADELEVVEVCTGPVVLLVVVESVDVLDTETIADTEAALLKQDGTTTGEVEPAANTL